MFNPKKEIMFSLLFLVVLSPYCVRAKTLLKILQGEVADFGYRYVDIHAEGITKEDLSKSVGKPEKPYHKSLLMKKPIGGCTDFGAINERTIWYRCLIFSFYL